MIRILTLSAVLLLSACGFQPMYGSNAGTHTANVAAGLDQIEISNIPDREGQYLRNALIDRFYHSGMPTNPKYKLGISRIDESIYDFDITIESEATRRQLKLGTTLTLTDLNTNKVVLTRGVLAIGSHNVLESEFSTIVTEQSARESALNDLARQIERQISLYLTR